MELEFEPLKVKAIFIFVSPAPGTKLTFTERMGSTGLYLEYRLMFAGQSRISGDDSVARALWSPKPSAGQSLRGTEGGRGEGFQHFVPEHTGYLIYVTSICMSLLSITLMTSETYPATPLRLTFISTCSCAKRGRKPAL